MDSNSTIGALVSRVRHLYSRWDKKLKHARAEHNRLAQAASSTGQNELANAQQEYTIWSGFFFSRYMLGLIAMGIIMNRIQNIVVPPRNALPHLRQAHVLRTFYPLRDRAPRTRMSGLREALYVLRTTCVPIDLSSTPVRMALRLPSLVLLSRAAILLFVVLLKTAELYPERVGVVWVQNMSAWVDSKEMRWICWQCFVACCAALVTSEFTAGLEGRASRTQSFNLMGYACLLHIYSLPSAILQSPAGGTGRFRPDSNAMFTVFMPLFQLTILHFMGIKRSWSQQRLIPTSICGILSVTHFLYVTLWTHSVYPLFTFFPLMLESTLLAIIALSIFLHALTHLLLTGHFSGSIWVQETRGGIPEWDEDWGSRC
ncbi:hypothetical protein BOTBODRAFT_57943 [Botryobasidium botryosum FD-172 SS1]|uniref:Uncharacterized protein n=1 Tax=Botryobasidium botryosum (strain FD-172 SS1) TaxID=930990 RepID=A0A067M4Q2_BOTB1|nr:hypothetical protein BOTBODRAFT_57943 [Botryobasidium botryosum FD-172 SS1]